MSMSLQARAVPRARDPKTQAAWAPCASRSGRSAPRKPSSYVTSSFCALREVAYGAFLARGAPLHAKEASEPVDEGPRIRSRRIQHWPPHGFVQAKTRRVLPRKPSVKLRLPLVDVLEPSALAPGLTSATLGQVVQLAGIVRNQSDKQILKRPAELIVRHDPDAEPWAGGADDQALLGNPVWQLLKLTAAPSPELIPPGGGVTVCIDHDAEGFESRGFRFGLHDPRRQDIVTGPLYSARRRRRSPGC